MSSFSTARKAGNKRISGKKKCYSSQTITIPDYQKILNDCDENLYHWKDYIPGPQELGYMRRWKKKHVQKRLAACRRLIPCDKVLQLNSNSTNNSDRLKSYHREIPIKFTYTYDFISIHYEGNGDEQKNYLDRVRIHDIKRGNLRALRQIQNYVKIYCVLEETGLTSLMIDLVLDCLTKKI